MSLEKKLFTLVANSREQAKRKRRQQNPSHNDIIHNLSKIKADIGDIFGLKDFDIEIVRGIVFCDADGNDHPLAILLLSICWLFIEQILLIGILLKEQC